MSFLRARGWLFWTSTASAMVAVIAASFLAFQYATAASLGGVLPPKGAVLNTTEILVVAQIPRYDPGSAQISVLIDGVVVPAGELQFQEDEVRIARPFADGPHNVRIELTSPNLFSRRLVQAWSFTVDTVAPEVEIGSPQPEGALGQKATPFRAEFSEDVHASLKLDGQRLVLDGGGASISAVIETEEGAHEFVLEAADHAGNLVKKTWEAWADWEAPSLAVIKGPEKEWDEPDGVVTFSVSDNLPEALTAKASLDGSLLEVIETGPPAPAADSAKKTKRTRKTTTTTLPPAPAEPADGRTRYFAVLLDDLAEGTHRMAIAGVDRGGHKSRQEFTFQVDSTDSFGSRAMMQGAAGRDAKQLNRVLIAKGFLEGEPAEVFDEKTAAALIAFRKDRGLSESALLDKEALTLLVGSIRIDISERKLYHYSEGKLLKTYSVAVGQPRYPTPRGDYHIVVKEYNPTWNPPPSPWAAGLEPVPPGPGNPLGTRWMGISAPAIGIHGTYVSSSIGTAASHGCIRMRISDVEEIFERVYVGTPVQIVP